MARTRLFARLTALVAQTRAATSPAHATHEAAQLALTRRDFVQRSLASLGALGALPLLSACGSDSEGASLGKEARVVIVGAGMAGLTCAYRLKQAGVTAQLYDGAKRTGGRMYSKRDGFLAGQVGELGGEFIDTGHLNMQALAEELGIELEDREAQLTDELTHELWWVNGKAVPEATIVAQFSTVAAHWFDLLQQADDEDDDTVFNELDNTSLQSFLDEQLRDAPELKSVLTNAYRGEYGREIDEQSALNLIYLIGSEQPDPFHIFGVSDERFHTAGGSETFPEKLTAQLETSITLEHKLVKASGSAGKGYTLTFETSAGEEVVDADVLVFAIPFSVLREVDLDGLTLSDDKRTVIDELSYGTNAKVMGAFAMRSWKISEKSAGSVTSDEPFQQLWDSSLSQPGDAGLLTNFLGGKQGVASGNGSAEAWFTTVTIPGAEKVFLTVKRFYEAGSAARMHWPSYPFTKGSYACYAPGQWAFWGTEGLPENNETLHFCGEHTSLDFQGYMEGAADTGSLVAKAVLDKLGVEAAPRHAALTHVRGGVPQPALNGRVSLRALASRRAEVNRIALSLARVPNHVG